MKSAVISGVIGYVLATAPVFGDGAPRWWSAREVTGSGTNSVANDYASVNQGQLKWMVTRCAKEFESRLPNGAGAEVWGTVVGFSYTNNNDVVNVGQLKKVVRPFYDRLRPDYFTNTTSGISNMIPRQVTPSCIYFFPLNTDPGWTRQGEWTFGHPTGQGGASHGYPESEW
jgi:hypothetical protein